MDEFLEGVIVGLAIANLIVATILLLYAFNIPIPIFGGW